MLTVQHHRVITAVQHLQNEHINYFYKQINKWKTSTTSLAPLVLNTKKYH